MKKFFERCAGITGANLGFLTLRLWLGSRALVTGLEKYAGKTVTQEPLLDAAGQPDISGATMQVEHKVYSFSNYHAIPDAWRSKFEAEPLLPELLNKAFCAALGPALVLLGVAVLFGVLTRPALFLMGAIYTAITVGLILIGQDPPIGPLAVHVALVAMALFRADDNRFTITRC